MKKTSLLMAVVMATLATVSAGAASSPIVSAIASPADLPVDNDDALSADDGYVSADEEEVGYEDFGLTDEEVVEFFATDTVRGIVGGIVPIEEAHATVYIPADMCFIDKLEAQRLLELYWGNPEDPTVLGALVPSDAVLMNDVDLAFIFYYDECGYVSDDDANDVDYDAMMTDLQEYIRSMNDSLVALGYPRQELLGWAKTPSYDSVAKVLRWAKHHKFTYADGQSGESLNYDCRILSRYGFLTLQAISDMTVADSVIAKGDELSSRIKFNEGYRYEDFNPDEDSVSDWTLGGLIAGTALLSKTGLLAKIGLFLLKGWKLILVAVVAVGGIIAKLCGKKKEDEDDKKDEGDDKKEDDASK